MTEAILITAACKRIGKCLAESLAGQGYFIYLHYHTTKSDAEATLTTIRENGGAGALVQCDLEDYEQVEDLLSACDHPDHPLRHVINNASQFIDDSILDFTEQSFSSHQNVNLRAPMQLARALYKLIPDGEKGSVVNIIDSKVFALNPEFHSYTLSKYALLGATEMMAQALSPKVRVNGIAPGLTLISSTQSKENFELASHLNFIGEPLNVEDIARTAHLLITSLSLNGTTIPVDGGQKMINFTGDVVTIAENILKKSD
ncbi:MAG: SDR family NAD(P)-dependent oxidoreductase [Emcibacter sp.]|nr:SDR family NAD(P)-dependent oxidoreductase [Emcibacter sp.]